MTENKKNRRRFLALGAGLAALNSCAKKDVSEVGASRSTYGARSPREKAIRDFPESVTPSTGASRTPLQDLYGMMTPSSLHFERHHAGVPDLDPATHQLLIHGLVEQPLVFTMDAIRRFPSVSRIHFVECSGNSAAEWSGNPRPDPQQSHGLLSCSEWTGVPLRVVLNEAKLKPEAKWIIAEGADACRMARSVPVANMLDDALLAYGQNGEAIRPEQGYPLRLVLPGWEGNINVKWLQRLYATDQPAMGRQETAVYTDLMPDGTSRIFTFELDAKSVITRPAGGQKLSGPGFHEITGMAWSGRGKITRVEVSADDGKTWKDAQLQEPVLSKAVTCFRAPWAWDGKPVSLQSRATDETGYVQPSYDELVAVRGTNSNYHYNGIKVWYVKEDGSVKNV